MKKIVRLTESDLSRIVKRVIKEQQTIGLAGIKSSDSEKNPSVRDVVTSLIKKGINSCGDLINFNTATFASSDLINAKKNGEIKDYSFSEKNKDDNDDPYNYIILNNLKYCYHESNDDTNKDWEEVTNSKVKPKIDLTIKKRNSKIGDDSKACLTSKVFKKEDIGGPQVRYTVYQKKIDGTYYEIPVNPKFNELEIFGKGIPDKKKKVCSKWSCDSSPLGINYSGCKTMVKTLN
jgi:hypothetical protein